MLEIRNFTRKDIPDALKLCAQAGWNHLPVDWERCLILNPQGCLGGFEGDKMKATCTLLKFNSYGWVGTFLVDQSLRGKGIGKIIFEAMLNVAHSQGITCLGLDSSDAGRPIYLKYGFQMTEQGNALWTGPNSSGSISETDVLQDRHWKDLLKLDSACINVDRELQLRTLLAESGASARVLSKDGKIIAFGFSRPGRMSGTIGPVIASDFSGAQKIILSLMSERRKIDGEKPVGLAVPDNQELLKWLSEKGFQQRRRNIRMFRPAEARIFAGSCVFASTGLGMG